MGRKIVLFEQNLLTQMPQEGRASDEREQFF
jgi:hypothetical protein